MYKLPPFLPQNEAGGFAPPPPLSTKNSLIAQARIRTLAGASAWSALTWSGRQSTRAPRSFFRLPPSEPGPKVTNKIENSNEIENIKVNKIASSEAEPSETVQVVRNSVLFTGNKLPVLKSAQKTVFTMTVKNQPNIFSV